ncbi:MAG: TonB-dependent receptor [Acidobacteriales bacterium]|nr:TonB-dependent receptor [Terriglobales bacterium]
MPFCRRSIAAHLILLVFICASTMLLAQSGTAGTLFVTAFDSTGAVIPGAAVQLTNPRSGFSTAGRTDAKGAVQFNNLPFNSYHVVVLIAGFNPAQQDVEVRSSIPVALPLTLQVGASSETVNVEARDLVESTPTAHSDVDTSLIQQLPKDSVNSGLFSVISQATPGVAQDSNGLSHPQGEHADTTFSIDGQPISDQQTRAFSNAISANAVQSLEVITGVPPAEYGDKASLVVRTTTKSGLGSPQPTGSIGANYGSYGTSGGTITFGIGNQQWGNFLAIDGTNSGRFLDPPEFQPIHDHGNNENVFDRIDYQLTPKDTLHLDLYAARSWFQIPNDIDQALSGQDQRQQNKTFNISPFYTHLFSDTTLLSVNAYVRQDRVGYFPSGDFFSDQPATLYENRRLTNAGIKTDLSYVRGIHNIKGGLNFYHTFLSEHFDLGVTDPGYNAVCLLPDGSPDTSATPTNPNLCGNSGAQPNPGFLPGLLPFDLTRSGTLFNFQGNTDIKQFAAYAEDTLTLRNLTLSLGLRGDVYRGLSSDNQAEPRVGASYLVKKTNTVLRGSYGRFMITPYNENLILSSATGQGGLATNIFGAVGDQPLRPGHRNYFTTGLAQAFGKYLSVDADYFWKYTDPDFDFDVILNTSLVFPIQWRKSKIDGVAIKVNLPDFHGLTAYSVMGHTRSRFFGPEVGGIIFNNPANINSSLPFRIDHDQAFQQVTHLQYQPRKLWPWLGFTWNYQSGLVAGAVPFATDATTPVNLSGLTADEQLQAGLHCGSVFPTLSSPLTSCAPNLLGATRVVIPAPGTENHDKNPPRMAPRNTFDAALGMDNIFRADRLKTSLRFTAVNLTNKDALYNFLSTFSGTHFIPARSYNMEVSVTF